MSRRAARRLRFLHRCADHGPRPRRRPVPAESYPQLAAEIAGFAGRPYAEVAEAVIAPYLGGEIAPAALRAMIESAYQLPPSRGRAARPARRQSLSARAVPRPDARVQGPRHAAAGAARRTCAEGARPARDDRRRDLRRYGRGGDRGLSGLSQVDVFILYPHGRVSDVQRRQMTTVGADNVHAIAIEGTFDDAQADGEGLFATGAARRLALSGVNSINWARIVAQIVYYFTERGRAWRTAPAGLLRHADRQFRRYIRRLHRQAMGLPIERLVIASNANDILRAPMDTGRYARRGARRRNRLRWTSVSSNFERLLFGPMAATARRSGQ